MGENEQATYPDLGVNDLGGGLNATPLRGLTRRVYCMCDSRVASNVMIYMGTKSMTLFDREGISPSCTGTHESRDSF